MPLVALFFRGMDVEEDRTTICKSAKNKTTTYKNSTQRFIFATSKYRDRNIFSPGSASIYVYVYFLPKQKYNILFENRLAR